MKKMRRIVLSICIAAMLISCLGAFAYADNEKGYTTYTVKAGDTVLKICQNLGIDFYANQAWITSVNNIGNYNDIKVGKVLYLPTFNTTTDPTRAINVKNSLTGNTGTAATGTITAPATTTTIASVATTATAVTAQGDAIVSYLIYYKLQAGETVGSVCERFGVDFDSNADKIKTLSGITNYYHIPVGQTIVIPSLTVPAGVSYTAIVAHKVVGGETVGSICNKYGLDFSKVQAQLKALNNTDNLNRITVGQTFYLPVPGAVAATTATTTQAATTPAPNAQIAATAQTMTNANNNTTVQGYKIQKQTSAHGSVSVQVNGAEAAAAVAGTKLNIVATPEAGYQIYTVTVLKTGGEQGVAVNNMSFTMPGYDVTVSVTFKAK